MTFSHHTRQPCIIIMTAFIAAAPYAHAMPQPRPAASQAINSGAVEPGVPTSAAPAAGTRSSAANPSVALPYSSLLGDAANALTEPVLVVPGKPMDPQAIDRAVEDLSIMSRIIEKNALGEYHAGSMADFRIETGFVFSLDSGHIGTGPGLFFPVAGRPKPMYLGGYGVLFFVRVDHPLLPPPQALQEQPTHPQEDPVWADAKRSVLEGEARPELAQEDGEAREPYSREQVDTLRNALIATMKHAANIRVLEPAEWVTIVVQGPAPAAPQAGQDAGYGAQPQPLAATAAGRTVLTLRASKANVDQYAKGQLDRQQFEQRLQVTTY